MVPPTIRRILSQNILTISTVGLLALTPQLAYAQHGGHSVGGGGHVPAPPPHMSAPPPRVAAPPSRPPVVTAAPRMQTPVAVRPATNQFVPPAANTGATNAAVVQGAPAYRNPTVGFPRSTVFRQAPFTGLRQAPGVTFYGDGHDLWVDGGRASAVRPAFGTLSATGTLLSGRRRRIFPLPRGPIYYPIFYPVGVFGGYPGFGLGFGFGLGGCDPFWGWSYSCEGFGYGDYSYDNYQPTLYLGPSEPDYLPVPSDNNTAGEQDDAVLYLTDGTIYLISDYWLADNKIHYVTSNGAEHTIDMDQIDLQKTVDVNAKRGVAFTLRPAPANNGTTDGAPAVIENAPAGPQPNSSNP